VEVTFGTFSVTPARKYSGRMEAASQNLISQLREIRSNLREALTRAENLEYKLIGPRPADAEQGSAQKTIDSVAQLLHDIDRLSIRLMGATGRPHEILGEFVPEPCETAPLRPARHA